MNPANRSGVTMIELMVVISLIAILTGTFLYMYFRSSSTVVEDQQTSAYYLAMSTFLESFQSDVRMARRVTPTAEGCVIHALGKTGEISISYNILGNGIRRFAPNGTRHFDFGRPLKQGAKIIFNLTSEAD